MKTVIKKAQNPITEEEYEIELPAHEVVRKAILELDYPPDGIRIIEATNILSEKFQLSDEQRNAKNKRGERYLDVFRYDVVAHAFVYLLKKEELKQPRGPKTPYFLALAANRLNPEKLIEENYKKSRRKLAEDLQQQIKANSPPFFEKLVVNLLIAMGYGGSWEGAGEITGGPGDGGIDGIIYLDKLGLDVVGVQAKRLTTGNNIGPSVINEFVGALRLNGLGKGVIITTASFSSNARASAEGSDNPKIVLIDGEQLAQLMIDHDVGVSIEKTYEIKRVDSDYFAENTENS